MHKSNPEDATAAAPAGELASGVSPDTAALATARGEDEEQEETQPTPGDAATSASPLLDFRAVHAKRYAERLAQEAEEQERLRREREEKRDLLLAQKLQREEEEKQQMISAALAERMRQLEDPGGDSSTAHPGLDNSSLQNGEDDAPPLMRTNYTERLLEDEEPFFVGGEFRSPQREESAREGFVGASAFNAFQTREMLGWAILLMVLSVPVFLLFLEVLSPKDVSLE